MKTEQIAIIGGLGLAGLYFFNKSKDSSEGGYSAGAMSGGGETYGGSVSGFSGSIIADSFNTQNYTTNNVSSYKATYSSFAPVTNTTLTNSPIGVPAGLNDTPASKKSTTAIAQPSADLTNPAFTQAPNWNNPLAPNYMAGTMTGLNSGSLGSVSISSGSGSGATETKKTANSSTIANPFSPTGYSDKLGQPVSVAQPFSAPTNSTIISAPKISAPVQQAPSFFSWVGSLFSGGSKKR